VVLAVRRAAAQACPPVPGVRILPLDHHGGLLGGRPAYLRQLRRGLAGHVDAFHVHGLARMAAWLLPRRARGDARLAVTAHSLEELGPTGSAGGFSTARRAQRRVGQVRDVLAGADAVLVPSRFLAGRVAGRFGRRPEVIPWGPTDAEPLARRPHDGFEALFLGRFVPQKGAHVLLEAFARALRHDAGARLVLAGEGPDRAALASRAAALGIADRVAFPGYLDGEARRAALARADVLAAPTLGDYETFCLSVLDGALAGCALLVADGGALPERAEAGGEVLPSGDVGAWAAALAARRADPEGTRARGEAAHRGALGWTWDHVARRHETAYADPSSRRP
jgi:glycosyltransferase involved in cell wall biosynthesis